MRLTTVAFGAWILWTSHLIHYGALFWHCYHDLSCLRNFIWSVLWKFRTQRSVWILLVSRRHSASTGCAVIDEDVIVDFSAGFQSKTNLFFGNKVSIQWNELPCGMKRCSTRSSAPPEEVSFFAHFCSFVPMDRQTQIPDYPMEGNRVTHGNTQASLQITALRKIFHINSRYSWRFQTGGRRILITFNKHLFFPFWRYTHTNA